jgi:hypothetical protein
MQVAGPAESLDGNMSDEQTRDLLGSIRWLAKAVLMAIGGLVVGTILFVLVVLYFGASM